MKRLLVSIALAFVVALPVAGRGVATAQGGISVDSSDAKNEFPNGITFSVSLHSDAAISKVTFRYTIPPEGANTYEEPECSSGVSVQCTFNLKSGAKLFLVPGANVIYYWQAEDAAGNTLETPPATFIYEDDRFSWKSVSQGNLTLWHYAGSDSEISSLLQAGSDGLQRMEQLLGTTVAFPVKVFIYDSAKEMQPAVLSAQEAPQEGVVTLGEVFFSDTAVVALDVTPSDVLRHELAHIVIRQAVKGPFGNLPAWLDEGTAVYAQANPLSDEKRALDQAIKANDVLSLRSMSSASLARTNMNVSLFYGQSWSLVSFLVDGYGPEKFAQLFAVFKDGSTVDKAFQQVYGFDLDGLENAWRAGVGLAPKQSAGGQEGTTQPLPNLTPFGANGGSESGGQQAKGGGFPAAAVIGLAALGVIIAVTAGVALRRRRRG